MADARGLVVLIEDEPAISDIEVLYLARAGFRVHVERDGERGLASIREMRPVATVVDIGVPGIDGVELCRRLRAHGDWTPVLFATARDDEVDRILGLELGADDYIVKPFSPRELAVRVAGIVRRAAGVPDAPLAVRDLRLDQRTRTVADANGPIELTATEFDLLATLLAQPDRVFSRHQLMSSIWGVVDYGASRTVDVHVAQLRAKLGPAHPIRTVRGVGYAFQGQGG
jgi:DNA-binding response OmpR family regulator